MQSDGSGRRFVFLASNADRMRGLKLWLHYLVDSSVLLFRMLRDIAAAADSRCYFFRGW